MQSKLFAKTFRPQFEDMTLYMVARLDFFFIFFFLDAHLNYCECTGGEGEENGL